MIKVSKFTAERLIKAAYEFEAIAARLRADGYDSHANSVAAISSQLGNVGRDLLVRLDK